MKKTRLGFFLFLGLGLALAGVFGRDWLADKAFFGATRAIPMSQAQTAPAPEGIAVEVAHVEARSLARSVSAVGSLSSENAVMLRPEIAGRIAEINFAEGGPVEKGQVLIRLDSTVARAELAQAQASLSLVSSQFRRAQELNRQGFISKQARDESSSQLQVQQAAVALAQAQLKKTDITAPFAGLVGLRQVSVGDYVSPGSDLVPLESIHPLNVDFRIPEQYFGMVEVGSRLVLRFDALADVVREGVVGAISPLVDVGGRSILLRAKVPNEDAALRPGMFARVQLQFADRSALVVPEAAISPAGDMNYVYRVEDDKAVRVAVVLGQRREGKVEITHGLKEGEQVLISGLQKVFDGAQIHILPEPDTASES